MFYYHALCIVLLDYYYLYLEAKVVEVVVVAHFNLWKHNILPYESNFCMSTIKIQNNFHIKYNEAKECTELKYLSKSIMLILTT